MEIPTPSASTWDLYPALAVLVLVILCITGVGLLVWKEYRKYSAEARVENQKWQDDQAKVRDERWQKFMTAIQSNAMRENKQNRERLAEMLQSINVLSDNNRKVAESVARLTETVAALSETLTGHIQVDDARFDVLLSDAQKQAIDEQVETAAVVKPVVKSRRK